MEARHEDEPAGGRHVGLDNKGPSHGRPRRRFIPRRLRDRALADVGDLPAPRYYRLKLK
jgi:hypothetical protein